MNSMSFKNDRCCYIFLVLIAYHVGISESFVTSPSFLKNMMSPEIATFSSRGHKMSMKDGIITTTLASKTRKEDETSEKSIILNAGSQSSRDRPSPMNKKWHIWKTIRHLEENGISCSASAISGGKNNTHSKTALLTKQVVSILKQWAESIPEQKSFLNKNTLLHEIEESIVALQYLKDWLDASDSPQQQQPIVIVDVCCGKGVFSMLASYIFQGENTRIQKIIMLDKDPNVNWSHIDYANQLASEENRPIIEYWRKCNLHEIDSMVDRLENETIISTTSMAMKSTGEHAGLSLPSGKTPLSSQSQKQEQLPPKLALVGIHLCKTLSPTCIGIVNRLGPMRCPFLCLAPCCLPRAVASAYSSLSSASSPKKNKKSPSTTMIQIPLYESPQERNERQTAQQRRKNAMKRGFVTATSNTQEVEEDTFCGCYLCQSLDHSVQVCGLLPTNEKERYDIFSRAKAAKAATSTATLHPPSALTPIICWRCGEVGHFKADCPSEQSSSKPSLVKPPTISMDVTSVLKSEYPFDTYCNLLMNTVQRNKVQLMETGLTNNHGIPKVLKQQNNINWNQNRKSLYIVATESADE